MVDSFEQVQAARQTRNDAITSALADIDKGTLGIRNHRYVITQEYATRADGWMAHVHSVEWCLDCGTNRADAEQRPFPAAWPEHAAGVLGFCGYTATPPGSIWPN